MSRRRSTGDLVPKDISEILARESRAQRGQRKAGSSIGLAFGWLKGSKRKKNIGNGLNRTGAGGVTEAKLGLQNHDSAKAGPKGNEDQKRLTVHYTASQHYQENVFIEGSRPQYLEDLHTEAQEGLKIQQQEENKNGVNFPEDESIASTDTLRPEQDISSKDGAGSLDSRSTSGNTDTTVTSAVSTRPVLTRQGSTFKPLNPVKRLDKSKKRSRRTTIMGIPNQVQKELALHRNSTFQPLVQLPNQDKHISGSQSGVVVIPTVDGGTPVTKKEGARVHLSELEVLRDDPLVKKHLQTVYQDDQSFNHQGFGSYLSPGSNLRPKSLAVPGMTTSSSLSPSMFNFLQEPQGPVMSISPQATYLSTIIPNAVLPASIEVIEIDRSSSRTRGSSMNHGSSVRTVSKSSLTSGDLSVSPSLSRRSEGDSSHNDSMHTPTSASGSNWSESSKTIMSNSSPVSSKSSTRSANSQPVGITVEEGQTEQTAGDKDHVSLCSSVSVISSPSGKSEHIVTGPSSESLSGDVGDLPKNKRNCTRSLSVMKTKQPPAPPRRTNSLHSNKIKSKIKDNSRNPADSKHVNNSTSAGVATVSENIVPEVDIKPMTTNTKNKIIIPPSNSMGFLESSSSTLSPTTSIEAGRATEQPPVCSTSSPQKTPSEEEKFERTMSPSSGYSSQSGTPTHSPKEISPTSPEKQKKTPVKPERSMSRASSSAASPSSSLTSLSSGTSELVNPDVSTCSPNLPPQGSPSTTDSKELTSENNISPFRLEMSELLNIPPPPKVKAPCPPPPETWVYNRRTFEMLCGPRLGVNKVPEKPALTQDSIDKQTITQTETRKNLQILDESQETPGKSDTEPSECVHNEPVGRKSPEAEQVRPLIPDKEESSVDVQSQDETSSSEVKDSECQEKIPKKEPPPIMKKPIVVQKREENVTEQSTQTEQNSMNGSVTPEILLTVETDAMPSQNTVTVLVDKAESETEKSEVPSLQTLAVEVPKITKVSPPPTPPPAYHPTPPPSRKTPSSVLMPPNELQRVQEESHIAESCWPPPPPPLEGESVFDGADEVDFPPPPPPFTADSSADVVDSRLVELETSDVHLENQDLAPTRSEQALPDIEPLVDMPLSSTDPEEDALSCKVEQNISSVSDSVTPSPVESPPIPNITSAESPVPVITEVPPTSLLKRNSLKIEDYSLPLPPVIAQPPAPSTVPVAPPLPAGVSFRRQPSVSYRDTRGKELLSRHKSVPIPKEDANIPLVTPSLLQMVRLRSVTMTEEQVKPPSDDTKSTNEAAPVEESCLASIQGSQNIPQKPIRKSLSLKSPPQHVKASNVTMSTPSMRLQEAIRMKTAAMSSRDGLSSRMGVRSPTYGCMGDPGVLCLKSPEGFDTHKSPASTASFIFSRSTKKVVVETSAASSPEAQAILKQSLACELLQVSEQSKNPAFSNGRLKCDKVPPPVAKKPAPGSISPSHNPSSCSTKMELNVEGNGAVGGVHQMSGITLPETTTRVTADTIETLF